MSETGKFWGSGGSNWETPSMCVCVCVCVFGGGGGMDIFWNHTMRLSASRSQVQQANNKPINHEIKSVAWLTQVESIFNFVVKKNSILCSPNQ